MDREKHNAVFGHLDDARRNIELAMRSVLFDETDMLTKSILKAESCLRKARRTINP
jgi:hypothetical protein